MKKRYARLALATGIYGVFMVVFLSLQHGFPGGVIPAIVASLIYAVFMWFSFFRRLT